MLLRVSRDLLKAKKPAQGSLAFTTVKRHQRQGRAVQQHRRRVTQAAAPARHGAPEQLRGYLEIVEVVDTREYEEGPDGKMRAIRGSGNERQCDRCARTHEVHATVKDAAGNTAVVGTGCMKGTSLEKPLQRAASSAKRQARMAAELRNLEQKMVHAQRLRAEVAALAEPPVVEGPPKWGGIANYSMGDESLEIRAERDRQALVNQLRNVWQESRMRDRGVRAMDVARWSGRIAELHRKLGEGFAKSRRVKQHQRRLSSGKTATVKEHQDPRGKRTPKVSPENRFKEHGDKQYLLTGDDTYLHSDTAGRKWNRSKIEGVDLRDEQHRGHVRGHLEREGYVNPRLNTEDLAHVRDIHAAAPEHPGHFEGGVERSEHLGALRRAGEAEDAEAEAEGAPESPEEGPGPEAAQGAGTGEEEPGEAASESEQGETAPSGEAPTEGRPLADFMLDAEIEEGRPLPLEEKGMNDAFLLKLAGDGRVLFKPKRSDGMLPPMLHREKLAFDIDELLGVGLVPATVEREHDGELGSMQAWIEGGQSAYHARRALRDGLYEKGPHYDERLKQQADRMMVLDAVLNHADRHEGNVVLGSDGNLHAIDNGLSLEPGFSSDLRSTHLIWTMGRDRSVRIPPDMRQRMEAVSSADLHTSVNIQRAPAVAQRRIGASLLGRIKYLLALDSAGGVRRKKLTTPKLVSWLKKNEPELAERMKK